MEHTNEWNFYLDSLRELSKKTDPKYAVDAEDAREALDVLYDCENAADSGDEYALCSLAAYKVQRGIDFAENLAYLEELAEKDNTRALNALGFLYAVGVFNQFDKSKTSLIHISDDANVAKSNEYFEKSANLGSAKAMIQRAVKLSLDATNDEISCEERENAARKAEEWAEKAKKTNEEGKCDCDWDYHLPILEDRLSDMRDRLHCK